MPRPTQPRKIPTQSRSARMVASLLEAAAQVLETDGLEGFNTNAVARRAAASVGSLYQYFPGKDALLIALMQRETDRFQLDAVVALDQPTGPDALRFLIAATVRQQLQRPVLARLLDIEEARLKLHSEATGSSGFQRLVRAILDRNDLAPQPDPAIAASDLVILIRSLVDAAGQRGETDLAHLERRVNAAAFGYLAAGASEKIS